MLIFFGGMFPDRGWFYHGPTLKEAPPLHQQASLTRSPLSRPGFPFVRLGEEHLWCFLVIWQGQDQGVVHVLVCKKSGNQKGVGWLVGAPSCFRVSDNTEFQLEKKIVSENGRVVI